VPFGVTFALAALLGLAPALLTWWWGRELVARADDPLLPERLQRHRRRVLAASAACAVTAILCLPDSGTVAGLLVLVTVPIASFPARRALYREEWSLPAYLAFRLRFLVAGAGLWLLLIAAPWIAAGRPLAVAAGLGAILLTGYLLSPRLVRWALSARPMESPVLPRLRDILDRSGAGPAEILSGGARGSRFANAFAIPSLRGRAVLVTDTVLQELQEDELVAIFAHETAHLEQYDRALLLRRLAVMAALALTGVTLVPRWLEGGPAGLGTLAFLAWMLLLLTTLVLFVRSRQREEVGADRRAVELTGRPEALITALEKLHALALLPRRLDPRLERRATHPSLARRIQAIRALAGTSEAPVARLIRSAAPGRAAYLDATAIHWLEGLPQLDAQASPEELLSRAATRVSVPYPALTELRVKLVRRTPVLGGRALDGRRWELPLEAAGVAEVSPLLDHVDGMLARPAPRPGAAVARLAALLVVFACLVPGVPLSPVVAALVAVVKPSLAPLLALAATAIAAALLTAGQLVAPLLLIALGAAAGLLAWRRRAETSGREPLLVSAGLMITALAVALFAGLASQLDPGSAAPRAVLPHVAALLLGSGAALAAHRRKAVRLAALVPAAIAAALALRERPAPVTPPMEIRPRTATQSYEVALPALVTELRLSPGGGWIAASSFDEEEGGARVLLSRGGAPPRPLEAADLVFLDEARALALVYRRDRLQLRLLELEHPETPLLSLDLPALVVPALAADAQANAYRVTGLDLARKELVSLRGSLAGGEPAAARWPCRGPDAPPLSTWTAGAGGALEARWRRPRSPLAAIFGGSRAELRHVASDRLLLTSRGSLRCAALGVDAAEAACAAMERGGTRLVTVRLESGAVTLLGWLPGYLTLGAPSSGTVPAWSADGSLYLVEGTRADRVTIPGPVSAVRASPNAVAALVRRGAQTAAVVLDLSPR